jgi:hypothetical protein
MGLDPLQWSDGVKPFQWSESIYQVKSESESIPSPSQTSESRKKLNKIHNWKG